jgi:hypothetical protein
MPDVLARWTAIAYRKTLCGHVAYSQLAGGWVTNCQELADFIRARPNGGHEYACGRHVNDFPSGDDDD